MNRREMLALGGAALLSPFPRGWAAEPGARKRRLLVFTKSAGFIHPVISWKKGKPSHVERVLGKLGAKHGFEITATKDGTVFTPDNLRQYDAFFFYTSGDLTKPGEDKHPPMTQAGKQALLDAVKGGKGFIGSHAASDSFHTPGERLANQDKPDPYLQMLGGEFIRHGPQQKALIRVADPKFPGAAKLGKEFILHEEWYALKNFAPNLHVILLQMCRDMKGKDYQRPPYPDTWARPHGKGRVFYTAMGHREDVWTNPLFQSILLGGIAWTTGNVKADVKPNLREVAPKAHVLPPKPA